MIDLSRYNLASLQADTNLSKYNLSALEPQPEAKVNLEKYNLSSLSPKIQRLKQEADIATEQARKAGSFGGMTKSFIGGLGGAVKKAPGIFAPAITNFTKTTGGIIGEGLAYATSADVREQYKKGGLEILPIVSKTSFGDLTKDTVAAGLETAIYKYIPQTAKMALATRFGVGALQGLGFAISEGMAKDLSVEEIKKNAKNYGVLGGAIEVVAPYLLPLLRTELKNVPAEVKNALKGLTEEAQRTPIGLSMYDVSEGGVKKSSDELINTIAKSTDSNEIAKLLDEGTTVDKSQIPQMSKVLVGIDKPNKVTKIIESFDVSRTPRKPFAGSEKLAYDEMELAHLEEQLANAPGRRLVKFESRKEGQFLDPRQLDQRMTRSEQLRLAERNKELYQTSESVFQGTEYSRQYDDPDVIRNAIDNYKTLKERRDALKQSVAETKRKEIAQAKQVTKPVKYSEEGIPLALNSRERAISEKGLIERTGQGVVSVPPQYKEPLTPLTQIRSKDFSYTEPSTLWEKLKRSIMPKSSLEPKTKGIFETWTRELATAKAVGNKELKLFDIPNEKGFRIILDYQAGKKTSFTDAIRNKFNALFKEAKERGLEFGYRENYLPQVWKESAEEMAEKIQKYLISRGMSKAEVIAYQNGKQLSAETSRRLKLNPYFSKGRVFPDYKTGMQYGLTPKYTNPNQLVAHYRVEMEKTLANQKFIETHKNKRKILLVEDAPTN